MVIPKTSKYRAGQAVILKDGRSGKITSLDPISNRVQVITIDNKPITIKITDIEKLEKPKENLYQISGVNPEIPSEINIKDTPFDLDNLK